VARVLSSVAWVCSSALTLHLLEGGWPPSGLAVLNEMLCTPMGRCLYECMFLLFWGRAQGANAGCMTFHVILRDCTILYVHQQCVSCQLVGG
jgi:hypothetical protein